MFNLLLVLLHSILQSRQEVCVFLLQPLDLRLKKTVFLLTFMIVAPPLLYSLCVLQESKTHQRCKVRPK